MLAKTASSSHSRSVNLGTQSGTFPTKSDPSQFGGPLLSDKSKGGGNSGGRRHTIGPPPPQRFWSPHPHDMFPIHPGFAMPYDSAKRKAHKLKKSSGHRPGVPGDTHQDKQGSTGWRPRDILLFAFEQCRKKQKKKACFSRTRAGCPGTPGRPGA